MSGNTDLNQMVTQQLLLEVAKGRRHANWRTFAVAAMFLFAFGYNFFTGGAVGINGRKINISSEYVSLVRLRGMIEPAGGSSPEAMLPALTKAFTDAKSKGVLLIINSPGGTPVQSKAMYDALIQLKKETGKRLVVLGEDSMTSGAYMTAMAADRVYANESSLTGSIGVFHEGWGLKHLAERFGVENRVIFSGEHKRRLDPFSDLKPEDVDKMQTTMTIIHKNFIDTVKASRGNKLKGDEAELFSGDFWTGSQAVELGLIDGVADAATIMDKEFGVKDALDYSNRQGFFSSLGSSLTSSFESWIYEAFNLGQFGNPIRM